MIKKYIPIIFLIVSTLPNRYFSQLLVLIVLIFILFLRNRLHKVEVNCLALSLFLLFASLIPYLFVDAYLNNFAWGVFNIAPFLFGWLIVSKSGRAEIVLAAKIFLIYQSLFLVFQYFRLVVEYQTINIFSVNKSAGDLMFGSLGAFSTPLAVMFSLVFYIFLREFLKSKEKSLVVYIVASVGIVLITGAVSVIYIFFISLALMVFMGVLVSKKKIYSIFLMVFLICSLVVFAVFQQSNFNYGVRLLSYINNENNMPVKVLIGLKSIRGIADGSIPVTGVGIGNFNSRAALIVSGEYLEKQPGFIPVTPSIFTSGFVTEYFGKYMYQEEIGGTLGSSMINDPFSQWLTILIEYGLLGLLFVLSLIAYIFFFFVKRREYIGAAAILFASGMMLTNAWFEYIEFSAAFWVSFVYFIKVNQKALDG